ncbi:uncharacterized protein LOC134232365 [Saccostrea cucullata]|uniref:uncharacterized protein LOC134232365 n=1 Tax=Saccostrea cuccullata TaxID=36930 RepID=UPI002ED42A8A
MDEQIVQEEDTFEILRHYTVSIETSFGQGKDAIDDGETDLVLWYDTFLSEDSSTAVQVRTEDGTLVGYLKEKLANVFAKLLKTDSIRMNHLRAYTNGNDCDIIRIHICLYGWKSEKTTIKEAVKDLGYRHLSRKCRRTLTFEPDGLNNETKPLLYSLLLMKNYTSAENGDIWEKHLRQVQRILSSKLGSTSLIKWPLNEYLTVSKEDIVTFISKKERDRLVQSVCSKKFISYFLKNADICCVKEYCRTKGYTSKQGEAILRVSLEDKELLIQRLGLEILIHPTIEDSSIHKEVALKLNIPLEVLSLGRNGYPAFLKLLQMEKSEICHAQGLILGCKGVGKTTLLKRLITEQSIRDIRASTKSTQSVEIHKTDATTLRDLNLKTKETVTVDVSSLKVTNVAKDNIKRAMKRKSQPISPNFEIKMQRRQENPERKSNCQTSANKTPIKTSTDVPALRGTLSSRNNSQKAEKNKDPNFLHLIPAITRKEADLFQTIDFYDFAGQYEYYATHHIYLRRSAFYILVMDMSRDFQDVVEDQRGDMMFRGWTNEKYLKFWLQYIYAFSGDETPSIILVATHAENKSEEDIEEYFMNLRSKMGNLLENVRSEREFSVSFDDNSNVNEIKDCIKKIAKEHSNWNRLVPNIWSLFERKFIEIRKEKKIMKIEDVEKLQDNFPTNTRLNRKGIIFMLSFFHEIGRILYFDTENLRDSVFLDVNFLIDAFKRIITVRSSFNKTITRNFFTQWKLLQENGELSHRLLDEIWKQKQSVTFLLHKVELLSYMKELCFITEVKVNEESNSERSILVVPCMNTVPFTPDFFNSYEKSSILCFQLPVSSLHVFQRLVTHCANKLWPITIEKKRGCIYQNVVIFEHRHRFIAIGCSNNTIQIQIFRRSPINAEVNVNIEVKDAIRSSLKDIAKVVHPSLTIISGFKCKTSTFCVETNVCFIRDKDIEFYSGHCRTCSLEEKEIIDGVKLLSDWEKLDDTDDEEMEPVLEEDGTNFVFDFISPKLKDTDMICLDLLGESHYADTLRGNLALPEQVFQILLKWRRRSPRLNHISVLQEHLKKNDNAHFAEEIENITREKYAYQSVYRPLEPITKSECKQIGKQVTRDQNRLLRFLGLKESIRETIEQSSINPCQILICSLERLVDESILNRKKLCCALNYIERLDIIEKLKGNWEKKL